MTKPRIALAAAIAFAAWSLNAQALEDASNIATWLQETKVPAVGIGIIRDGKLRQVRVYGELRQGEPAPYDTIFNVASLAKPIVSMLTLQLVSEGKWSLDEPLAKYWVDPDVADDPRHRLLTTRHVLRHMTGFPNWRWMAEPEKLTFHFDPGTRVQYSGEGFEYLRKALEKKFGATLPQLSKQYVFDRVGMRDTRQAWDERTDESRFARWHDAEGKNSYTDHKTTRVNAADDLLTTVEDYGRFGAWVLGGAGLPPAMYEQMVSGGLGWEVHRNFADGQYALIHSGGDRGVNAVIILLPKTKEGLIVLTNSDNGFQLYGKVVPEALSLGTELMKRAK